MPQEQIPLLVGHILMTTHNRTPSVHGIPYTYDTQIQLAGVGPGLTPTDATISLQKWFFRSFEPVYPMMGIKTMLYGSYG